MIAGLVTVVALEDGGSSLTVRSVAAVLVWWTILTAVALSLAPRASVPRAAVAAVGLLLTFGVFSGISTAWAPSAERAVVEMDRVLLYAGALLVPVLFTRRGDAGRWADGLAIAIAVVAILAAGRRLFPGLLGAEGLADVLPAAALRLTYPLGYWNGLGIFLALGVPLLLRGAVTARSAWWRGAAVAPLPLLGAGIWLTSSRGAAAVAIVAALTFAVLAWHRRHAVLVLALAAAGTAASIAALRAHPVLVDGPLDSSQARDAGLETAIFLLAIGLAVGLAHALLSARVPARLRVPAAGWVAVAVAAVVAAVALDPAERLRTFKAAPPEGPAATAIGDHLFSAGGSGRWQFWSAALDEFSADPVAGGGAGSYEAWWAQHGSLDLFVRNAHSLWFETLGELGIVGALLLVGVFAVGLVAGAGRLRDGPERTTVAALIAVVLGFALGASLDWVWQLPVVPLVALLALGLLVGPATAIEPDAPSSARMHFGARVGIVLVGWAVVIVQAVPFVGAEEIGASRRAAASGDLPAAVEHARSAQAVMPWAASPRLQLALAHEELGELRTARRHLADAIERDRADWRLRLVDARLAAKSGDIAAARRALDRARELNPRSQLLRAATP